MSKATAMKKTNSGSTRKRSASSSQLIGARVQEYAGIICIGETYRNVVKLDLRQGRASLKDPSGLFNSSLEGNTRRAIDIHKGDEINEEAFTTLIRACFASGGPVPPGEIGFRACGEIPSLSAPCPNCTGLCDGHPANPLA
jgi:hypothetical protein